MDNTDLKIEFVGPQRIRRASQPWRRDLTLEQLAEIHLPEGGGFTAMVDGEIVDEAIWGGYVLHRGSTVKFVADFGFLAAFLVWALPAIFTTAGMASTALGPITWGMIFNTVGAIGASYLINSLMPGPQLPKGQSSSGSPATSWDPKTTQREGLRVPRHNGTFRAHGNIISCYTAPSADGRKQLIFALVAFAGGPIASVSEITANGRDAVNVSDLTTEVRLGNVTQTHVSFFDKTRLQYRFNKEISNADGPETISVPDDDYDDLELLFRYDAWLRYPDGDAGYSFATIKVEISVRDSGSWTELFTVDLGDSSTEIKWVEFLVSDYYALTRGVLYDLRITKTNVDANHDRRQNNVWLEAIKEVIDVPFTYPGMVLVGLSGISSQDLPGFMDVSALLGPRIVDTYNGATWSLADDSSDPAWALWDIFTLPLITGDGGATPYAIDHYRGMAVDRVNVADFFALSLFCNEFVPDADGNDERRITFNGITDFDSNIWDVAKLIAEVARCLPVWNGNRVNLAINKRKTRSGIISVGNILNGSFEETFAPKIDAASEIDAQFNDKARDYTRRTIPFFNPNSTNTGNKISINLPGLVKLTEVTRHIKGRLKQTELRRRVLVADCGVDAIGYEVGDMIGVQEDVPDWGELGTRGGGRVVTFAAGLAGYAGLDCVGHWKLADNTWSTLHRDASGNANHATAQRKTVHTRTAGLLGDAYAPNGSSDYSDLGDPFASTFAGSWSFSIWLRPLDGRPAVAQFAFGLINPTAGDAAFLACLDDGRIQFGFQSDGDLAQIRGAAANLPDGQSPWTHVVCIADSTVGGVGGLKLVVNGALISGSGAFDGDTSSVVFAAWSAGVNPWIGCVNREGGPNAADFFEGALAHGLLFGRALTVADAVKLYNGGIGRGNLDYDTVTLDGSVEDFLEAGHTYELALRLRNAKAPILKTVISATGAVVEVTPHFSATVPHAQDVWALGKENIVLMDFTIEQIQRYADLKSRLTLLQYVDEVFDSDDEVPQIPIANAVLARVDRRLTQPLTRGELRTQIPPAAMEFPNVDVPMTQGIDWNDNDPGAEEISWTASDVGEPLTIAWRGTTYEIAADDTSQTFVFFDTASPTIFQSTNTLANAYGPTRVPVCINHNGVPVPIVGIGAFHAALILDLTVVTAKIANLAVTEAKIGLLAVTEAKIGNLAVAEAKIGNLEVTTIKIADNATSVYNSSYTAGSTPVGATYTTIQSVPITSVGGIPIIVGSAKFTATSGNRSVRLRLTDGSVTLAQGDTVSILLGTPVTVSISAIDLPGVGAVTYYLQAKADLAFMNATIRIVAADESKGK